MRERADRAVVALAERLEKIADVCSTKLTKGDVACVDASFADAARDYQGYFGDHASMPCLGSEDAGSKSRR